MKVYELVFKLSEKVINRLSSEAGESLKRTPIQPEELKYLPSKDTPIEMVHVIVYLNRVFNDYVAEIDNEGDYGKKE